jgi:hypothetical protein
MWTSTGSVHLQATCRGYVDMQGVGSSPPGYLQGTYVDMHWVGASPGYLQRTYVDMHATVKEVQTQDYGVRIALDRSGFPR